MFEFIEPRKSVFFTIVNRRRLGIGTNNALSMDRDCDPLENVEVLVSTLVNFILQERLCAEQYCVPTVSNDAVSLVD